MKGRGAAVLTIVTTALAACASGAPRAAPSPADAPRPSDRGAPTDPPADSRPGGREPLIGGCGPAPTDLDPLYVLPFPAGTSYTLTQGNCGSASHGGRFRFAFDFEMPIGTPLIAARDGVVFDLRENQPNGTGRVGDENFLIIEHEDGEYSRYIHLTTDGVLVREGERVSRGDTIAYSGHSGRSAFPHLHFDVAEACRSGRCRTIPSAFLNADPPIPDERQSYEAADEASLEVAGS